MVFALEEALWKASLGKAFGFLNFLRSGKVQVCTFLGNRHQEYLGLQAPLWKPIRQHPLNPSSGHAGKWCRDICRWRYWESLGKERKPRAEPGLAADLVTQSWISFCRIIAHRLSLRFSMQPQGHTPGVSEAKLGNVEGPRDPGTCAAGRVIVGGSSSSTEARLGHFIQKEFCS